MSTPVRRAAVAASALCFVSVACSTLVGVEPPTEPADDAGSDATVADTGLPVEASDAGSDADVADTGMPVEPVESGADSGVADTGVADTGGPVDSSSPSDGGDASAVTYGALTDPSAWDFFNTPAGSSFTGAAFDGQFVYFPSISTGKVVRYDSRQPFTASAAWSNFSTSALTGIANEGFNGATFDGTYVYFVPRSQPPPDGGSNVISGLAVRFDTRNPDGFSPDAGSGGWSVFDMTTLPSTSDSGVPVAGFAGATFDGHYLYFIPTGGYLVGHSLVRDGLLARFDPTADASFGDPAHWSVFDTSTTNPAAVGFYGGVYDGRYLYPVPSRTVTNQDNGVAVRFDTTAPFQDAAAWTSFNLGVDLDVSAVGYSTGAFDGRYVYFAPNSTTVAVRYDTQGGFSTAGAWSTYDLFSVINATKGDAGSTSSAHFGESAFDGRYVYFVANSGPPVLVRYDTQGAFNDVAAWAAIDIATANLNSSLNANFTSVASAVFDGQYLYLAPVSGGLCARFKAKSPPAQPSLPAFKGSFF
jgi:hypothetical protein